MVFSDKTLRFGVFFKTEFVFCPHSLCLCLCVCVRERDVNEYMAKTRDMRFYIYLQGREKGIIASLLCHSYMCLVFMIWWSWFCWLFVKKETNMFFCLVFICPFIQMKFHKFWIFGYILLWDIRFIESYTKE